MNEHCIMVKEGYEGLVEVLVQALEQAQSGKGAERHGNGLRFEDQRMLAITRLLNSERGLAYQACKKVAEGLDLPTHEARVKELLGAINYIAGIIIFLEEAEFARQQTPQLALPLPEDELTWEDMVEVTNAMVLAVGFDRLYDLLREFDVAAAKNLPASRWAEYIKRAKEITREGRK